MGLAKRPNKKEARPCKDKKPPDFAHVSAAIGSTLTDWVPTY